MVTASKQDRENEKQPRKSRIPKFTSIEAEAEFWDTHDSTEFEDEFEEVDEDIRFVLTVAGGALPVWLDKKTLHALARQAVEQGTDPSALAAVWIGERLRDARRKEP